MWIRYKLLYINKARKKGTTKLIDKILQVVYVLLKDYTILLNSILVRPSGTVIIRSSKRVKYRPIFSHIITIGGIG